MTDFSFRGISALSMGVVVSQYPPIIKAKARIKTVEIPGRSGLLTLHEPEKVYEPVEKKFKCRLLATASQAAVSAWLDGSGALIVGNEPLYAYSVIQTGEITFEKIMAGYDDRRFDLEFTCQPWKELVTPGADIALVTNPQTIISSGTLDSLPLITITGVGAVSINIGSYSFTLSGIQAGIPVKVDCEAMTVTNSNQSVSYLQNMTGQFPKIAPGNNEVSWSGTVTSVVIKPRYRWL